MTQSYSQAPYTFEGFVDTDIPLDYGADTQVLELASYMYMYIYVQATRPEKEPYTSPFVKEPLDMNYYMYM